MKLQLNKDHQPLPIENEKVLTSNIEVPIEIQNWIEKFPYSVLLKPFHFSFRCAEKNTNGEIRRLRLNIDLNDWTKP